MLRQLKRALKPAFTDIVIDWGPLPAMCRACLRTPVGNQKSVVQQSPYRLPPLFSGSRVLVYALLPPDFAAGSVTFRAMTPKVRSTVFLPAPLSRVPKGPYSTAVALDPAQAVPGKLLHRLAARSMIRDLQARPSSRTGIISHPP